MKTFLALAGMMCLAGCSTLAAGLGYVPVDVVDGGPPPSVVGIEEAVGISSGASIVAAIGLNLWRNWTRAKMVASKMPQGAEPHAS